MRIFSNMRIKLSNLRNLIREALNEIGGPTGALRQVRGSGGRKHKIGKIEDENRELSFSEAEMLYPGSTDAWAEIVPLEFEDFPFGDDPLVIKRKSIFFKEGDVLTVAFQQMPQVTLATWNPVREDWFFTSDFE
jgi:hypothetical protein